MIVDGGSIVRGPEVVPHDEGPHPVGELAREDGIADRFRHLLPVDRHQPVVHPMSRERVTRGRRLRQFVLVVRKSQVEPAPVDVELLAEIARRHRRAFDVPSRAARAPGRIPAGRRRLGVFRALPKGEVAWASLSARIGVGRVRHVVRALPGEFPVGGPGSGVEVDIRSAIRGWIGVPAFDENADQLEHLRNARRRPWFVAGRPDAEACICRGELELDPVCPGPPLFVGAVCALENLVVDVGHVAYQGHVEVAV